MIRLQEFTLSVECISGQENAIPDALSRIPCPTFPIPAAESETEFVFSTSDQ